VERETAAAYGAACQFSDGMCVRFQVKFTSIR